MNEMELTIPTPRGDIFAIYTEGDASESMCPDDDSGRGEKPLVILCHGLMMNCRQNPIMGFASSLNKAGYDTLRFDFRGSGLSSGDITEMTPLTEVDDLKDVVAHYKDRRIVLCGHSLGGLVSLMTAAEDPSISALVLLAPAVNIELDSRAGRVAIETFDPVNIPEFVEVWGSRLSRSYFTTAQNLGIFERIAKYNGPVCVLMGERDRIVELNLSEKLQEALPQAQIHAIPHADHLFSRGIRLKAAAVAVDFLRNF